MNIAPFKVFYLHRYYIKPAGHFREKYRVNSLLRTLSQLALVDLYPFPIVLLHDVIDRVAKA